MLQNDFLAKTKGSNWYHMIVHCFLYCFPFYIFFGLDWRLLFIFVMHVIIDALKARYHEINYVVDQLFHYFMLLVYLVF